jgi:hypothetical protein
MQKPAEMEMRKSLILTGQSYHIPLVILATLARCRISEVRSILSGPAEQACDSPANSLPLNKGVKMIQTVEALYWDAPEIRVMLLDVLDFYVNRYVPLSEVKTVQ